MGFKRIEKALEYYIKNYFELDNEFGKEQTRALFTAYCLIEGIEADLEACNTILEYLHSKIPCEMGYEEFDDYMSKYLA